MIYRAVSKQSPLGAPESVNYPAMITACFIRYVERFPTVKDLVRRLKNDESFKMNCGFLVSDSVPSESTFSRLVTGMVETNILEAVQSRVIDAAITAGFICDDTVAIDATHFKARDQAPAKEEKSEAEPKKRGRKPKAERAAWLKAQAEKVANAPLYEKKIEAQLNTDLETLRDEMPFEVRLDNGHGKLEQISL